MNNVQSNEVQILNSIIQINHDRIEGYRTAIGLMIDLEVNIQSAFEKYSDQSMQFKNELIPLTAKIAGNFEDRTEATGKLFRVWMDIKAMSSSSTRQEVWDACIRGEEECNRAYKAALECLRSTSSTSFVVVDSQSLLQREALIHIQQLRNKAVEE